MNMASQLVHAAISTAATVYKQYSGSHKMLFGHACMYLHIM